MAIPSRRSGFTAAFLLLRDGQRLAGRCRRNLLVHLAPGALTGCRVTLARLPEVAAATRKVFHRARVFAVGATPALVTIARLASAVTLALRSLLDRVRDILDADHQELSAGSPVPQIDAVSSPKHIKAEVGAALHNGQLFNAHRLQSQMLVLGRGIRPRAQSHATRYQDSDNPEDRFTEQTTHQLPFKRDGFNRRPHWPFSTRLSSTAALAVGATAHHAW